MAPPIYPEPLIIPSISGQHKQSFIILHRRGSEGELFSRQLLQTRIPELGTLQNIFPDARFVSPTAAKRRAQRFNRIVLNQWFDTWSLDNPTGRGELQVVGLRESSAVVHALLNGETKTVGAQNVVIWGISQGCATSIVAMLLRAGPRIAAAIGMCGYLPLRKRMMDAIAEVSPDVSDNPFAREPDDNDMNQGQLSDFAKAVACLRDELGLAADSDLSATPQTPVFLGHDFEDDVVPIRQDKEAAEFLTLLGIEVRYQEYEVLGHWFSGTMLGGIVHFVQASIERSQDIAVG